jgi:Flp pilus assembly protein TadB
MQRNTHQWKQLSGIKVVSVSTRGVPFTPGVVLILLGAAVFLAPKLFLAAVGSFFVLIGVATCYIVWKFMSFKRNLSKLAEEFKNSVDIRTFKVKNSDDIDITESDSKKIFYH